MANTLMFEVGVQEAKGQLTALEKRLAELVQKYGSMKIQVEVQNLQRFINTLESIGNGKQLEPLLRRIDLLQTSLANMGTQGATSLREFETAVKTNTAVADQYRHRIEELTRARDKFKEGSDNYIRKDKELTSFQSDKTTLAIFAQEKQAIDNLASAQTKLQAEEKKSESSSAELNSKIEALSSSITKLAEKESTVKIDGDFTKWAQEVNSVVTAVSELIEQLQKLHSVQGQSGTQTQQIDAQTQAINKESEAYKQLAQWREQAERFFASNARITDQNTFVGHAINGIVLGDKDSLETLKQHIYLQKDENRLLAERKLLEEQIAKSKIRKYDQKSNYQDVLSVYDKVLAALQKVKQEESKPTPAQGGLLDPKQLTTLQEAIDKIIGEINRLREAFAGIGKIEGIEALKTSANGLQVEVNNLVSAMMKITGAIHIDKSAEEISAFEKKIAELKTQYEQLQAQVQQTTTTIQQQATAANNAGTAIQNAANEDEKSTQKANIERQRQLKLLSEVNAMMQQIANTSASSSGINPGKINEIKSLFESLHNSLTTIPPSKSLQELYAEFSALKSSTKGFFNEIKQGSKAVDSIRLVRFALKELNNQMASGKSSPKLDGIREQLQSINREMHDMMKAGNYGGIQSLFAGHKGMSDGVVNIIRHMVNEMKKLGVSTQETAGITSHLTAEEQKLANAISHSSNEMKNQSQILSDLKTMALQYLSVWGAQSFINSIIETGGQLEQQRLSLSAILGDMEKANTLFGQVKQLALKSPFGVVQIDQMTKQLSAYSFEYEELFDWTKRLADISAATGTSVDRLALALGHVRSEGALSGYTLRQFAMANVPVLKMLSENLGISSKEVRERVRKKEIGAEDVQEILKQLTDEGGMFYNAQEVMSQALNAKFKNLRDAFDIMYGEIAESGVGDRLKELATILTQGAKEWERFGSDILMVATAFGVGRAAIYLYNTALGQGTVSALKNVAANEKQMQSYFRLAKAAGLVTESEYKKLMADDRASVTALKLAISNNKLTIAELQRAVALGKVRKEIALAAVANTEYEVSIKSVTVLNKWQRGLFLLGEGFKAAKVAMKGFFAAAWPLLALSVVFDMFNRTAENNDAAKGAAEGAAKATNKYQDLQAMTERLGTSQGKTNDQLENNIKAMKEALIAVGEYTEELKKQVESVDSLAEKYNILQAAMKGVSDKAADRQSRKQNLIEKGLETGSGTAWAPWNWFRDNALKDAKDIDDYTKELNLALDQNDRVLREGFQKILTTNKHWKKEFEHMSAKDIFMSLGVKERDDVLYDLRWGKGMSKAMQDAGYALASKYLGGETLDKEYIKYSYLGAIKELKGHKEELAKAFLDAFRVDYPNLDLSNNKKGQQEIFAKWLDMTIENLEDVKEAGKKALNDIVIEGTIKVRPKYSLDNENFLDFMNKFREKNPLAYYEWEQHGRDKTASTEEQKKSAESYGKTFGSMTDSTLGNTAKKQLKELKAERARLVAEQSSKAYKEDLSVKKRVDDRLAEIKTESARLRQAQKDFNQYGDPDKSRGSHEDKEAKKLRERVRILKEAADSYQYWREKVGEAGAETHMQEEFGQLLTEQNLQLKNADELKAKLKSLRDEYSKKPQTKAMVEAIKEIDKELAQLDRKDFEKKVEEFASKVQIELDGLTRAWDMFNSVREATGNVELAVQISGADYQSGKTRNLADALKEKIQKDFDAAGGGIAFDMNLSDKDIEEQIKKATPKASEEQIKGLVEEYKKWRDLQRDVLKSDIDIFSKLVGSVQDYDSQIQKINDDLAKQIEALKEVAKNNPSQKAAVDKAIDSATLEAEEKRWQISTQYINLMNNSLAMTREEVDAGINKAYDIMNKKLEAGKITAKEYAEEMDKIRNIQSEWTDKSFFGKNNAFTAGLTGGISGRKSYYKEQVRRANAAYANTSDPYAREYYKRKADESSKKLGKEEGVENLLNSFDGLAKAMDPVINLFDQLGMKGIGSVLSAGQTALNQGVQMGTGLSMISSSLGPYGMAIGAGLSIMSSLLGGHDESLQAEIDALKANNEALESNTDAIKAARERTLGYDTGELRRKYAEQYAPKQAKKDFKGILGSVDWYKEGYDSANQKAMYEFYKQNSKGSGYAQELKNLKEERENYIKMYAAESSKKDVSSEALEEYKKKISELDDQITYFTEDLANSLWDIDIKGWADQIGDALWTAFENGEDAAKAFGDTAKDIVSNVAKKMWQLSVLERIFNDLRDALFGEKGTIRYDSNGNIDMKASEQPTMDVLGKFFGEGGIMQKAVEGGQMFYEWAQKVSGLDFSSNEGGTSSKVIQGGFTESETGLILSYMNAMRADVSMQRADVYKIAQEHLPSMLQTMTQGNAQLVSINQHVAEIERTNSIITERVEDIRNDFHGLRNGVWKMPMA